MKKRKYPEKSDFSEKDSEFAFDLTPNVTDGPVSLRHSGRTLLRLPERPDDTPPTQAETPL